MLQPMKPCIPDLGFPEDPNLSGAEVSPNNAEISLRSSGNSALATVTVDGVESDKWKGLCQHVKNRARL